MITQVALSAEQYTRLDGSIEICHVVAFFQNCVCTFHLVGEGAEGNRHTVFIPGACKGFPLPGSGDGAEVGISGRG
jgi:hypothetical protein